MRNPEQTIGNLIDHQKTVYLASVDGEGYPAIRAMLEPREREGIKVFYLTTNTSSQKVKQFRANPKGALYFCDRRFFRGITLRGTVEVLEDTGTKERIWRNGDTLYYPGGVTDPDYCVLRFTADRGFYYASFHTEEFVIE